MQFQKILKTITGISTPIFGVQWNPPQLESDVAKEVVIFLENCRVLYQPIDLELGQYCRISVEEIRRELTSKLQLLNKNSDLAPHLRSLRNQCRRFCDAIGAPGFDSLDWPVQTSILNTELLKLRKTAGKVVGILAISYGLDVEDALASILPFKLHNTKI